LLTDEKDIVHQLNQGNTNVFEELFRTYYARLCGYALKYVWDKDQAEDIVQELFYAIWNKREAVVIKVSVEAYLFRSVRNSCLNYLKHLKVRDAHSEYATESSPSLSESSHELMEFLELQENIDAMVDLLPPERKKIFLLSRMEGLKYKDIAMQLDISVKTVEAQMGKALSFLREKLTEYLVVITLTAAFLKIILIFLGYE